MKTAIEIVAKYLPGNKIGLEKEHLSSMKNPNGEGVFIYIPETNFLGVRRNFCWLVLDKKAFNINGATNSVTPNLPFTRDGVGMCERSGVGSGAVSETIKLIFGG